MPARSSSHSILKSVSAATSASKLIPNAKHVRRFTGTPKQNVAVAIPSLARFIATSVPPPSPAIQFLQDTKYTALKNALYEDGNPSRVWTSYTDLLNAAGFQHLPIEIHQEVLRRCTPPAQEVRVAAARRFALGNRPTTRHLHESKFQTIIRNIRVSGAIPSLDDYHFVLSQFAAVGNYPASMNVYKELKGLGHVPTSKTFGVIFQAIAHRFSLPISRDARPELVEKARKAFEALMEDMRQLEVPLFPANVDLMFRILKETMDYPAFEAFMRWAYGIDMSFPDRIPLELLERKSVPSISGKESVTGHQVPVPFTTHALNTTIDFLGRTGNISKMIQAFEVLTQPLPHAQEHFFSSFEDDEDDVGAVLNAPPPSFTPPHAQPNTTTYSYLIHHAAWAKKHAIARHYLNEAIWLNQQVVQRLRHGTWNKPDSDIDQPSFSLNRNHILPVIGLGNTNKDLGLLQWLLRKMPKIIRKKEADLEYHISRQRYQQKQASGAVPPSPPSPAPPPPLSPSLHASGSSDTHPGTSSAIFDLDFDSTAPPTNKPVPFNPSLHIQILRRDVEELKELSERVEFLVGRTSQRVKERLGRRVWEGKDIYLASKGHRVQVSKSKWEKIVNFKPKTGNEVTKKAVDVSKGGKTVGKAKQHSEETAFFSKSSEGSQAQIFGAEASSPDSRDPPPHERATRSASKQPARKES